MGIGDLFKKATASSGKASSAVPAARLAELASKAKRLALSGASPEAIADAAVGGRGLLSLPEDATETMDHSQFVSAHMVGARNESHQSRLARSLREASESGSPPPDEYLRFLSDAGIDSETISRVADGSLPMDAESRAARATALGINPGMSWYRVDSPGKTEFRGRARNGLVYAGFTPKLAREASQAGSAQTYPLIAAADISGFPPEDRLARRAVLASTLDFARLNSARRSDGGRDSRWRFRPGTQVTDDGYVWSPVASGHAGYGDAESLAHVSELKSSGRGGRLVRDEGGISVALLPPKIRHAILSVLSPRHAGSGNIFYSMPVAGGVLNGLREDR
jgi:hypothetical protein